MPSRNPLLTVVLSTLGMFFWLACDNPGGSAAEGASEESDEFPVLDEGSGGSALPCAVPLAWRVVRVDRDFGLPMPDAQEALRQAIGEWEEAAGRTLFTVDPDEGSPIRLVYDERQARSAERAGLVAEMREILRNLDQRREQHERRSQAASVTFAQHEMLVRGLQARVSAHNDRVRYFNERGGASPEVLRNLRGEGQALERENLEQVARSEQLEELRQQLETERTTLEEDLAEYNRLAADIDARLPPSSVESGVYREAIRLTNGRPTSASRQIRIYRFSSPEDLVRVIAHELGHALGIGHVEVAGALMSAEYGPHDVPTGRRIRREDVDALIARCPALFGG